MITKASPASVLRTLANPSNRCAVSEPVSATPASVLRTLANPYWGRLNERLPCVRGGGPRSGGRVVKKTIPHRLRRSRTRLGDACKHAPHTRKSLYTKEPENSPIIEVSFAFLQKPCLCSNLKLCTYSPITKVSFAYFSFQRKVRSKKSRGEFKADDSFERSVRGEETFGERVFVSGELCRYDVRFLYRRAI